MQDSQMKIKYKFRTDHGNEPQLKSTTAEREIKSRSSTVGGSVCVMALTLAAG